MISRGRFAPTPSGALHVGSARTALASALAAWRDGGRWVLRVEDLDVTRAVPGAVEAMLDDLRWLGLSWDEGPDADTPHAPYRQGERADLYREALDVLRAAGRVYPCACSRREVEEASRAPHGAEPVYPGTCARRDPEAVLAEARAKGRGVAWRFRVAPHTTVTVRDAIAGTFTQRVDDEVGDFVVFRAMGIRTLRERGVSPDTLRGELLATLGISDAGDRPLRDLATRWSPAAVPRLAPRWSVSANRFEAR